MNSVKGPRVHGAWMLGGVYLGYTAVRLFQRAVTGQSGTPALGLLGGGVMAAAALWLFYQTWRAWRRGDGEDTP